MSWRRSYRAVVSSFAFLVVILFVAVARPASAAPRMQSELLPTHLNATAASRITIVTAPSTNSARVTDVARRGVMLAFGRDASCTWIQVVAPDSQIGWAPASSVTLDGDCDELEDRSGARRAWLGALPALVEDFEDFGWQLANPPNGRFYRTFENPYGGAYAGAFAYDFPADGDGLMLAWDSVPIPGQPMALTLWVNGDGSGHQLSGQVQDADGNAWLAEFGPVHHVGWKPMMAHIDATGKWLPYLLDNVGRRGMVYPLVLTALMLRAPDGEAAKGTIVVDNLYAVGKVAVNGDNVATAGGGGPSARVTPTRRASPSSPSARATPTRRPTPGGDTASASGDPSWSFWADADTITAGECATLYWETSDVYFALFHEEEEFAEASGERTVCPDETTDFVFTVVPYEVDEITDDDVVVEILTVTVVQPGEDAGANAGGGTGEPYWTFYADPNTIAAGECTTVYWNAADVFAVAFHEDDTNANLQDSREVCPDETTDYSLYIWPDQMASLKRDDAIHETVTVYVVRPEGEAGAPNWTFRAEADTIAAGECTTLYWDTNRVYRVAFHEEAEFAELRGSREVCPSATTEYMLYVYPTENEAITERVTVFVVEPGEEAVGIDAGGEGGEPAWYFWPDPELIRAGECTTLYWQTENVWGVWFQDDWVDLSGSREVCPTETTEYTLDVYRTETDVINLYVTVMVDEAINEGDDGAGGDGGADDDGNGEDGGDADAAAEANWSIGADRTTIYAGECTIVYWETSGVSDVFLDTDRVGASGEREVCPTETETFILGIWLADGSDRTDWVTVEVLQEGE